MILRLSIKLGGKARTINKFNAQGYLEYFILELWNYILMKLYLEAIQLKYVIIKNWNLLYEKYDERAKIWTFYKLNL